MRRKTLVPLQKMASIFHIWHFHREIGMKNQTNLPVIAHHGVISLNRERTSFPAWAHTSIFMHLLENVHARGEAHVRARQQRLHLPLTREEGKPARFVNISLLLTSTFQFQVSPRKLSTIFSRTFSICCTLLQNKRSWLLLALHKVLFTRCNQALFCFTAI